MNKPMKSVASRSLSSKLIGVLGVKIPSRVYISFHLAVLQVESNAIIAITLATVCMLQTRVSPVSKKAHFYTTLNTEMIHEEPLMTLRYGPFLEEWSFLCYIHISIHLRQVPNHVRLLILCFSQRRFTMMSWKQKCARYHPILSHPNTLPPATIALPPDPNKRILYLGVIISR